MPRELSNDHISKVNQIEIADNFKASRRIQMQVQITEFLVNKLRLYLHTGCT